MADMNYWYKQKSDQPLFSDLLWSRPERKAAAGKLAIIGGNLHAFAAPAEAFSQAQKAGAGNVKAVLPDAAKKLVGPLMQEIDYAPSTPSGSFSKKALAEMLDLATWADSVLLAGDLGRNSETAITLENFVKKYQNQLTLTKDAVDYFVETPVSLMGRGGTALVLSFAQLQKFAMNMGLSKAFTFDMDLIKFVELLHEFTTGLDIYFVVQHGGSIHSAVQGQIVSHKIADDIEQIWRVKTAAHASVWWMQNPTKPLEAFASAVYDLLKDA